MANWERTTFPGVYFREHPTRKHGVTPDRYYSITYRWEGKKKWEVVGWASQGMKPSRAASILSELKENQRTGQGPVTLAEKRQDADIERKESERKREEDALLNITFKSFAEIDYFPVAELSWKPETARKHKEHCSTWLCPSFGDKPLRTIAIKDINKLKAKMLQAERSPRTLQAVFRTFTSIWNAARDEGLVLSKAPTRHTSFKLPRVNNVVERFLSLDEEKKLFKIVKQKNLQAYQMAVVSVETGMRFGEIAGLTWGRVDLDAKTIRIINAKGDKSRSVPMTERTVKLFKEFAFGKANGLVFPSNKMTRHQQVPKAFKLAVVEAGLNEDSEDRKTRFGFHGLRHTYASRLVQAGTPLSVVQILLGHSTPVMTARYAHLAPDDLRAGVDKMEAARKVKQKGAAKVVAINQGIQKA